MKQYSTLFLKLVIVFLGIVVLALCIFLLPWFKVAVENNPKVAYLPYLVLSYLYITAIIFFFALYQSFKLLYYIDKNKAFSELSLKALNNIKKCAFTISSMYIVAMPFIFHVAQVDDAPGLAAIGLIVTFASVVISVFAAVLQKLLKNVIDIKLENDLTV